MSETRQWVERFEALRDDLASGDLNRVQRWVQNDGALTEIAEGIARLTREVEEARETLQLMVTWEDWIDDPDWLELVEDARNVIAKVTGEEGRVNGQKIRRLICCVCGEATRGRQWWNRDNGFGICPACADRAGEREDPEEVRRMYGERGVHYDVRDAY